MKGQLIFDEFMNISEEQKTCAEIVMPRTQMLDCIAGRMMNL